MQLRCEVKEVPSQLADAGTLHCSTATPSSDAGQRERRARVDRIQTSVFTSQYGARIITEEPIRELKNALKLAQLPDYASTDMPYTAQPVCSSPRASR